MIYSNKVLYCLSFISLVTVCIGYTSSEHLIKGKQYADRPLAVMTNRLYSLLGGTGNIPLIKSMMGILLTKALAYVVVTLGLYSLITKEG